jgi:hypothetical protein
MRYSAYDWSKTKAGASSQKELAGYDSPSYQRAGGDMQFQEQQDAGSGPSDNRPQEAKTNGADNPEYRISVTLLVADHRQRDADGALSTVLDCLIHAIGRLTGLDSRNLRKAATCEKRRRRGGNND